MSNWREMIERPEMQAMSDSHRAWQQQLQQAEMQAQAAAQARRVIVPGDVVQELGGPEATQSVVDKLMATEAQAQRADEPFCKVDVFGRRWVLCADPDEPVSVPFGCASLLPVWRNPDGSPVAMSDPPQSEKPATDTSAGAVQRRIDDVCQDLVAGRTTPAQQRGLGGAVERAGRIPAGSDAAVGRIARLPR